MPLLPENISVLLALSVWIQHLPSMHDGQYVGYVLQRNYVAMSRLWWSQRLRQSVGSSPPYTACSTVHEQMLPNEDALQASEVSDMCERCQLGALIGDEWYTGRFGSFFIKA